MEYMYKLFYNLNGEKERTKELQNRYNGQTTKKTKMDMKPIDQTNIFNIYYVPTENTMRLVSEVYKLDGELKLEDEKIPQVAKRHFLIELIASELFSTNEIEGVKSSKEEIVKTARNVLSKPEGKVNRVRFESVLYSYFSLSDDKLSVPDKVEDIRTIYDKITDGEIEKSSLPDGKLFRKEIAYVFGKDIGKEIHRGIYDEQKIIEKLNLLFGFMEEKECDIISIAIAHYYFGYIHPFYDWNGRTGRFISSIYLNESLSSLTAMSLAQGINFNKNKYYDAFHKTNQVSSQGELNYFVDSFLELLISGQKHLKEELESKSLLIKSGFDKIDNDDNISDEVDENIMGVLVQEHLFNRIGEGVGAKDLIDAEILGLSNQTIIKRFKSLEERGLVYQSKGRPLKYKLSESYLEN